MPTCGVLVFVDDVGEGCNITVADLSLGGAGNPSRAIVWTIIDSSNTHTFPPAEGPTAPLVVDKKIPYGDPAFRMPPFVQAEGRWMAVKFTSNNNAGVQHPYGLNIKRADGKICPLDPLVIE